MTTAQEATVAFKEGRAPAGILDEWTWLIGTQRRALLFTASGNAFVEDGQDGSVLFLDANREEITPVAASRTAFDSLLADPDFVDAYFNLPLLRELRARGMRLARPGLQFQAALVARRRVLARQCRAPRRRGALLDLRPDRAPDRQPARGRDDRAADGYDAAAWQTVVALLVARQAAPRRRASSSSPSPRSCTRSRRAGWWRSRSTRPRRGPASSSRP